MAGRQRHVQIRRIYDDPTPEDGTRVLVDRLRLRGMSKRRAALDEWCKDVAPSTELRKWYGHDPARFDEFSRRYRAELADSDRAAELTHLRARGPSDAHAAHRDQNAEISEAAVLAELIADRNG
jgi:uncharacterized protein YeaO (DUF488 family)